jgi:hypothetical protein
MITLSTHNFTTCGLVPDAPTVTEDAVRAQLHWLATREILPDYALTVSGSFTTIDPPFGIQPMSAAKIEALVAGIQSAQSGKTVDLGSFARFADDEPDEG